MKTRFSALLPLCVLLTTSIAVAQQKPNSTLVKNYGKLPLSFEKNVGQTDKRVKFFSRGNGYSLFLTPKEAVFSLAKQIPHPKRTKHSLPKPEKTTGAVLRMQLVGANSTAKETTEAKLSGTTNYFVGKDQSKWRTGVENFGRVGFAEVYKGVDVVYYGNQSQLEYDFIVKPKAQASEIRLKFAGAKRVKALPSGELLLETGNGSLKWHAPVAYQESNGKRRPVQVKYTLTKGKEVCFAVGEYDKSKPLVIDPVLSYSTYLGGSDFDGAYAIAVDSKRCAFVAGRTQSADFPAIAGAFQANNRGNYDVFVTRLSADGMSPVFSTYLGGADFDNAEAIAVDRKGHIYVAGFTNSGDFYTTNGAFQTKAKGSYDGFVTKLSANGNSPLYSTYLGGADVDIVEALTVNSTGNAYVTGFTRSTDFPTPGAIQKKKAKDADAFVTKLSTDGRMLVYSTYLGGNNFDAAYTIAMDASENIYVAGSTKSTDFHATAGAVQAQKRKLSDAFVAKLNADGKGIAYSTYLGGGGEDSIWSIAVDTSGSAYLAGITNSPDLQTTVGAYQTQYNGKDDGFVVKLSADGQRCVYFTYLGGKANDYARAITVDDKQNAYVAGWTNSTDLVATSGSVQTQNNGGYDAFVMKLSSDGRATYFTYLGGGGSDGAHAIALDDIGNVYVAGDTTSVDFPTTVNAYQTQYNGKTDGFVRRLDGLDIKEARVDIYVGTSQGPFVFLPSYLKRPNNPVNRKPITTKWRVKITNTANGKPIPNVNITIKVKSSLLDNAGHDHENGDKNRPHSWILKGIPSETEFPSEVTHPTNDSPSGVQGETIVRLAPTDNNGGSYFTTISPEVAGIENLNAICEINGRDFQQELNFYIKEGDLIDLSNVQGQGGYVLTGETDQHGLGTNHFGTKNCLDVLQAIADEYRRLQETDEVYKQAIADLDAYEIDPQNHTKYDWPEPTPENIKANRVLPKGPEPLIINDISLKWGGLFDVEGKWLPDAKGHMAHRQGRNADLKFLHLQKVYGTGFETGNLVLSSSQVQIDPSPAFKDHPIQKYIKAVHKRRAELLVKAIYTKLPNPDGKIVKEQGAGNHWHIQGIP